MNEFVDLKGASGASYRFRLLPKGADHLRIAGNYAVLKPRGESFTVVHLAMTSDLSQARATCPPDAQGRSMHLYTRLNIARRAREAEHEDMLANYAPPSEGPAAD
jgi:hypothetical protein